jgi:undecaprenyl-diphosphatase
MNDYLLSLIFGIVEGLTEFLPVSSTAHLRISEALLHVDLKDGYWKMYTIVIQLGAVLCLPVYFRARITKFLATFPKGERGDRTLLTHPVSLVMIAFVVTAIPAFLLSKVIGKNLESLYVMGTALLVGGIAMWVIDALFGEHVHAVAAEPPIPSKTARVEDMTLVQAIWIGAVQVLSAVFPGTSRSMATIAAGQTAGMTRAAALEFSFFLSLPTMAAATVYDFYKTVIKHKGEAGQTLPPVTMDTQRWIVLAIGFVVSFLVALLVVHWFMGWVRKRGFTPFAIYRIAAGIGVLAWAWYGRH